MQPLHLGHATHHMLCYAPHEHHVTTGRTKEEGQEEQRKKDRKRGTEKEKAGKVAPQHSCKTNLFHSVSNCNLRSTEAVKWCTSCRSSGKPCPSKAAKSGHKLNK